MNRLDRLARGCPLPRQFLEGIQRGTMSYTYKGIPTFKDPFDLALYQLLLWEQKPRTLIEIGSRFGGSALWFSDILRSFDVECTVHSIDIESPAIDIPGALFYRGDGRNLAATLSPDFLATIPRPLLVVEDADHRPDTTLAVLRFFDPWLRAGEYIVIEDGIIDDVLAEALLRRYEGGPRRGVGEFLRERGEDYEIDGRLCDFFGENMTWNVNGYLRRLR